MKKNLLISPILLFVPLALLFSAPPSFPPLSSPAFGETPAFSGPDLFPFEASGENLPNVWDAPSSKVSAGERGFIHVENDHFANDDGPVRFW